MKKYIKSNLTIKLFLLIASSLVTVSLIICFIFSIVMPSSFEVVQSKNFEKKVNKIVEEVKNKDNSETIDLTMELFALENNIYIEICQNQKVIMNFGSSRSFIDENNLDFFYYDTSVNSIENIVTKDVAIAQDTDISKQKIEILNQTYDMLIYGGEMQTVNIITSIINNIIPWILLFVLIISSIIAWYSSKFITNPIKKLRNDTKQIANLDFNISPLNDRTDELGELSQDINTLAINLNNAINKLHSELELEKQLEQKQRLFFAAASHELKTPLTIIKSKLEGMIYGYGDYKDHEIYLPSTLKTATQMEKIITDILNSSQLEDYSIQKINIHLQPIIENILEQYSELISAKKFKMSVILEDLVIIGDETMFTKAIQNIIGNAILYTSELSQITITLTNNILSVENFGVNISSDQVQQLCDPFYRIEKSRNKQTGGTGLGLCFVKQILEKHNLQFEIIAEENSLIFKIYLL